MMLYSDTRQVCVSVLDIHWHFINGGINTPQSQPSVQLLSEIADNFYFVNIQNSLLLKECS